MAEDKPGREPEDPDPKDAGQTDEESESSEQKKEDKQKSEPGDFASGEDLLGDPPESGSGGEMDQSDDFSPPDEEETETGSENDVPELTARERGLALLSHLVFIIPVWAVITPLIIFLIEGEDSSYVSEASLTAFDFQLTILPVLFILVLFTWIPLAGIVFSIFSLLTYLLVLVFLILAISHMDARDPGSYPISFPFSKRFGLRE